MGAVHRNPCLDDSLFSTPQQFSRQFRKKTSMPFKDPPKICKLKFCSQEVKDPSFDGYCSKRHFDIARQQQTEPFIERPTPLTSVPIQSEGHAWRRNDRMGERRGFNYREQYEKPSDDAHRKEIFRVTSSGLYLRDNPEDHGVEQIYCFNVDKPLNDSHKFGSKAYGDSERLNKTCTRAKF
ncbi:MAG: hypothetical protein EZS28_005600 [Streblomastix strix]|uniref:Uncharacterized protein n=1 Tax=Streblomastix strix TaxID=222440 RepID=A0A5J4WVE4_9EUKA|nr:MAG: hypothetical protein EZS28_005600 [Streblomastix strix]